MAIRFRHVAEKQVAQIYIFRFPEDEFPRSESSAYHWKFNSKFPNIDG